MGAPEYPGEDENQFTPPPSHVLPMHGNDESDDENDSDDQFPEFPEVGMARFNGDDDEDGWQTGYQPLGMTDIHMSDDDDDDNNEGEPNVNNQPDVSYEMLDLEQVGHFKITFLNVIRLFFVGF